jgi:hypothetical protein
VPDEPVLSRVAHGEAWQERSLFALLDPSRFTLLVVRPIDGDAAVNVDFCGVVGPWPVIRVVEIAAPPSASARARFDASFGRSKGVFLVRPDGYLGFVGGKRTSDKDLDGYCRRWLIGSSHASRREHRG